MENETTVPVSGNAAAADAYYEFLGVMLVKYPPLADDVEKDVA